MRASLFFAFAVGLATSLTACSGAIRDKVKGGRQTSSSSSSGSSPTQVTKQQEQKKIQLVADGLVVMERMQLSKNKLFDLQDKLPATDADLQNVSEYLDTLSSIAGDIEKDAAAMQAIAEAYGAMPKGTGGESQPNLQLLDAAADDQKVNAQILARRIFRTASAIMAAFKSDTSNCQSTNPAMTARVEPLFMQGRDNCAAAAPQLEPPPQNGFLNLLSLIRSVIQYLLSALQFMINSTVLSFLGGSPSAQLLTNRAGGDVLHASKTMAIFWGPSWATDTSDKINGIDQFFNAFGGSRFAGTSNEYYDASGHVTSESHHFGHVIDISAPPEGALSNGAAVAEVCKMTNNQPDPSAVYFIYTSTGAGKVDYCAWHTWGTCPNLAPVLVAYEPNPDSTSNCNQGDTSSGHSSGLASLVQTSAHELIETTTDPRVASWGDFKGDENADKCMWHFPPIDNGLSTLADGSKWKLSMTWSNEAFKAGTGEPNDKGFRGCIY